MSQISASAGLLVRTQGKNSSLKSSLRGCSAANVIVDTVMALVPCSGCILGVAEMYDPAVSRTIWLDSFDKRLTDKPLATSSNLSPSFEKGETQNALQAIILRHDHCVWALTLLHRAEHARFGSNDVEVIAKLCNSFATLLQQETSTGSDIPKLGWAVLNRFSSGVILFDSMTKVVAVNEAGNRLLGLDYGVHLSGSQLRFEDGAGRVRFHEALAATMSPQGPDMRAVKIHSASGKTLQFQLTKLVADTAGNDNSAMGAIFVDPQQNALSNAHILQELYGLTRIESEVVSALSDGMSTCEAAQQLKISIHTARGYLKAIFRKTGAHRQSDIVRLAVSASNLI
jgi:DNA-binding CsgD family transcriptional regulator